MKTNRLITLILVLLLFITSCKKSSSSLPKEIQATKEKKNPLVSTAPPYPNAEAQIFATTKNKSLKTFSAPDMEISFGNYNASTGKTDVTIVSNKLNDNGYLYYITYLINSVDHSYVTTLTNVYPQNLSVSLPVGSFQIYEYDGPYGYHSSSFTQYTGEALSRPFIISAKPNDPPTGFLNLYRYYNPLVNRHFYSTDWNGIGPIGFNYQFEKVQGLLYANPGPGLTALYEFYNSTSDDHWYTTNSAGYPGYTYHWIVGYLPTSATTEASLELNEYYGSNTGHIYGSPPEVINDNVTLGAHVGYIVPVNTVYTTPQPIYLFYNSPGTDHFISPDINAVTAYSGWSSGGVVFHAYLTQMPNTVPVYEYYNASQVNHYDSANPNAVTGYSGWSNFGIKFYAYPATSPQPTGTIPIYLFYDNINADHYLSPNVNAVSGYSGWSSGGVAFYAFP